MFNAVYVTLDIGENKSKLLISTVANKEIAACASFTCESNGIKNGEIVSRIEFQKTISHLLSLAQEEGYDIKEAIIILPSNHLSVYQKRATQEILSANRLVTERDVDLLQRACARHQLNSNDMVVGIYPINYSVNQNDVIDTGKEAPIGYKARSVTLNAYILVLPRSIAKGYTETLESLGISVLDAVVAPYANSYLLLSEEDQKQGALILDLGAQQANMSYFKDYLLSANYKMKIGSENISEKLAELLNSDVKTGEMVKVKYGNAIASTCSDIGVYLNQINQAYIKEVDIGIVCENVLDSLISDIKRTVDINLLEKGLNLYITGGGANLANIALKISRSLGIKASVRQVALVGVRNPIFSACLGAVINYISTEREV